MRPAHPQNTALACEKYMRAVHGFKTTNHRISEQCCLRVHAILTAQLATLKAGHHDQEAPSPTRRKARLGIRVEEREERQSLVPALIAELEQNIWRMKSQLSHHVVEQRSIQLIVDSVFEEPWLYDKLYAFVYDLFKKLESRECFGLSFMDQVPRYTVKLQSLEHNQRIIKKLLKYLTRLKEANYLIHPDEGDAEDIMMRKRRRRRVSVG